MYSSEDDTDVRYVCKTRNHSMRFNAACRPVCQIKLELFFFVGHNI